jgi:hypothetical protein
MKSILLEIAEQLAATSQGYASQLQREIFELEQEAAQKKAALDAARLAPKRLADYPVTLGADYACPYCWFDAAKRSPLRAIPGGTREFDLMKCDAGHEIEFPTGL